MRAVTRTSPSGVNLSALEMKLRRICDSFLSSVNSLMSPCGSSNTSEMEVLATMGLNMPRSAENRSTISNHSGEMVTRPASTLARSSRSPTMSVSSRAEVRMNSTCFCCSDVNGPSRRDSRMPVMLDIEVSGVRNSWLMYERKRLLSSVASRRSRGLVVELGVQRHHALVGLIELLAQRDDVGFARRELRLQFGGHQPTTTTVASSRSRPWSR